VANLLSRFRSSGPGDGERYSLEQYVHDVAFAGNVYQPILPTTYADQPVESIETDFAGVVQGAYKRNGVIFACQTARLSVFAQATFCWQQVRAQGPGDTFTNADLAPLQSPWVNGSEGELLARMIQDVDNAGNSYVRKAPANSLSLNRLERLRPDWVDIVLAGDPGMMNMTVIGYLYYPGGRSSGRNAEPLILDEVAHWSPYPDPIATYRGMSPITPVLREVTADNAATTHKGEFFNRAAPQPLTAKVLTSSGWTTMGALVIGSDVIGSDGKAHQVTGVYPQGERDIYRVRFSDRSTAECTEDHVWAVANLYDRRKGVTRTMSLREMVAGGLRYASGPAKWAVPFVEPVQYDGRPELPVDPYLLGLLLGNGSFRSNGHGSGGVTLACHQDDADELEEQLASVLPPEVRITRRNRWAEGRGHVAEFYFRGLGGPRSNPLTQAIRTLGLFDLPGRDKFIPGLYLVASVEERLAMLQGLIDSDGSISGDRGSAVRYTTTSHRLAEHIRELVGSLGGAASIEDVPAKGQWTVHVKRLPEWMVPCRLARKVERYRPCTRAQRWRYITGIEHVGSAPAQCIRVDVPDHLYVTDDYVLTHNTPNLAIKFDPSVTVERFEKFKGAMETEHAGLHNAWKTLYLGGGADPVTVGMSFRDMDYKAVQALGEPLALDTPVPTPSGWTTMGAITPGDVVFGRDGLPARVLGVSPVHTGRPCYRVTFSDRTSIVADAGHLWTAIDRQTAKRGEADYTTEQLADLIATSKAKNGSRMAVPAVAAIKGEERDLLVDPYVLGCWLGDGQTAGAAICKAEEDLAFIAGEIEARGYTVTRWATAEDKAAVIGLPGGLLAALRALDVLGNKHIPVDYLRGSIEQRLDLLRGLMDTDGTVGHVQNEVCEFSSKWRSLAEQVAELARSLGYRTSLCRRVDERSRTGEHWRLTFRADPRMVPFLLPRKAGRCITPPKIIKRSIVSVEPTLSVPVRCIAVDTADHLFLAGEGMVPTHNTRIAAAYGVPAVIAQISEGLAGSSLNTGNFSAARRLFADRTMRWLWKEACASLQRIVTVPPRTRLWWDERQIAFLREDQKDAADIQSTQAQTITALVREGFTPESAVASVMTEDWTVLEHTGALSVQLVKPSDNTNQNGTQPNNGGDNTGGGADGNGDVTDGE
jgi:intein/homing endonuclease